MSQIQVTDLTYGYNGSFDTVFENVSFGIDTDWKLGLIGRNGKGKTTFLNLLRGKYKYEGNITSSAELLYRPFKSLSHGEQTKVLLAVLFSGENDFLLIDEPTNHLAIIRNV